MTTIKMNAGRTQYDVEESYMDIKARLMETCLPFNDFMIFTDTQYGEMLLSKSNILSIRESRDYEK